MRHDASVTRTRRVLAGLLLVGAMTLGVPAPGEAIQYTFTKIAGSSGEFVGVPTISADGTVAFQFDFGRIHTGTGAPPTLVADIDHPIFLPPGPAAPGSVIELQSSINGLVAGIFKQPASQFTNPRNSLFTASPPETKLLFTTFFSDRIDHAAMAFFQFGPFAGPQVAFLRMTADSDAILRSGLGPDFSPFTTIASTGPGGSFSSIGLAGPSINSLGTVAFLGDSVAPGPDGVFASSGGPLTTIATIGGKFAEFDGRPAINRDGMVAFWAKLTNDVETIQVGDGSFVEPVAGTADGTFLKLDSFPGINSAGHVVFQATIPHPGPGFGASVDGIFIVQDPALEQVFDTVVAGEHSLFGSKVATIGSDLTRAVNDAGQIAFRAGLINGMEMIVRANPIPQQFGVSGEALAGLLPCTIEAILGGFDYSCHFVPAGVDSSIFFTAPSPPSAEFGFDFQAGPGKPNFTSVLLPPFADDSFVLHHFDGSPDRVLHAGVAHVFPPGGVDHFQILGIERRREEPDVFTTGLSFASTDEGFTMNLIVTPISAPEPTTLALFGAGLAGLTAAHLRRRHRRGSSGPKRPRDQGLVWRTRASYPHT